MSKEVRTYTIEYKVEAVKLAREIGTNKAASELGVPYGTLYGWIASVSKGNIDTGKGTQTPETAMTQAARIKQLETENKALKKEIAKIAELNEFLEEAASFFAASRKKSTK